MAQHEQSQRQGTSTSELSAYGCRAVAGAAAAVAAGNGLPEGWRQLRAVVGGGHVSGRLRALESKR